MIEGMRLVRLTDDYVFKPFDCGEKDLNDFLLFDSKEYLKRLISVTYIIETEDRTVAFFSLSNDRISMKDSDKATWRRIKKLFITDNRTGCVFVTVDSLRSAIPFYERNGFGILDKSISDDKTRDTCPLYYDLSQLVH